MILFADSSALAKLYVEEQGSARMRAAIEGPFAVSLLAFGEIQATLARRQREGLLTSDNYKELRSRFQGDWEHLIRLPIGPETLAPIPRLCERHPLRGADALQLASALILRGRDVAVTFACSDQRLLEAAAGEGFEVFDPAKDP